MFDPDQPAIADPEAVESFIATWRRSDGTESANSHIFLDHLCQLLDLPKPQPSGSEVTDNAYAYERRVDIQNPDGSFNRGYIDLYRRDCFVLEAKQSGKGVGTTGWDKAIQAAYNQADEYVRALPAAEGRPPFIVVLDVGRTIALFSEFTRTGGTYVPYPDPRNHRIRLEDLRDSTVQHRLKLLWEDPDKLDPSKYAAQVTRAISAQLAELARSLEEDGYDPARVAHFLKRCLFTMFSEDVALLPEDSFTKLLERLKDAPEQFPNAIKSLWESMDNGGFCGVLTQDVLRFNGSLFKGIEPIPLNASQIQLLIEAGRHDWRYVEPAIFGTLLERALDPRERHKLGAHFTPRAYVERLVQPTLVEPLRDEWKTVQAVAANYSQQGKADKALKTIDEFHYRLCQVRVLDPACGSGNFLYVAMEHLKRLEGEVLDLASEIGGGQDSLDAEGLTVSPQQFHGIEINPRAAAITEIVLWIGYLQWHFRIHGRLNLPEPILQDFENIENRDALIEYDSRQPMQDVNGEPVTIWDGISYKESPTTGELVPDESGRTTVYHYSNPRQADWPQVEYILGNPPFIGASTMRRALGDGYVDAVRAVFKGAVPDSADFVMYWWHIAAEKVRKGEARRFGFITTNSLRQTFNRRVVEPHLRDSKKPLSLAFAIPDHPWVDSNVGAAVRIAMTVGAAGEQAGTLRTVVHERSDGDESRAVDLSRREGKLFADLGVGANVAGAVALQANQGISNTGVKLHGSGFIVNAEQASALGLKTKLNVEKVIRQYRNGRDLTQRPRGVMVIDLNGYSAEEVRTQFPEIYQWILEHVKPERDHNREKYRRENWWLFGRKNTELRSSLRSLSRYISTSETAKHRVFQFLDADILPDNKLINIALDGGSFLGLLSSRPHTVWSLAAGSRLGVGNDPVYVKTRCFETFPFPPMSEEQARDIAEIAERLDKHRKIQLEQHPGLTLTGMYNVLEKERAEETLTAKDRTIHEQGLVSILKELHDELDRAVFAAYGWDDLADTLVGRPGATSPLPDKPADQAEAEEELLSRLVDLNKQRAAEEARGHVRWLRPEYQAPEQTQGTAELPAEAEQTAAPEEAAVETQSKPTFPKDMAQQIVVVRDLLAQGPRTTESVASHFKHKPKKSVGQVLSALEALGQIRPEEDGEMWRLVR